VKKKDTTLVWLRVGVGANDRWRRRERLFHLTSPHPSPLASASRTEDRETELELSNHLHLLAIHALCLTTCLSGCTSTRDAAPEQNTEVITHALELPRRDAERSPVSASFKNGFAVEHAFMDDLSPKDCFHLANLSQTSWSRVR
jgi:hypothetical protein